MSATFRNIMSDVNYGISNVGTVMTSCAGSQHQVHKVKFFPNNLVFMSIAISFMI